MWERGFGGARRVRGAIGGRGQLYRDFLSRDLFRTCVANFVRGLDFSGWEVKGETDDV